MKTSDLAREYESKSDQELLRLSLVTEELTEEAKNVLADEMARRRIDSSALMEAARHEEQERKAQNERDIGTLGFSLLFFSGRMRFGKGDRVYDPKTASERFKTTVFIVLFCFPLIPTGTYIVQRNRESPLDLTSLERLPLDWEQVLRVWVVATGSILAFIWLIRILSHLNTLRELVQRLLH